MGLKVRLSDIVITAALLLPAAATAQSQFLNGQRMFSMAEGLELTPSQQEQVEAIIEKHRNDTLPLRRRHIQLRNRINNLDIGELTDNRILLLSHEMGKISSLLTKAMLDAQVAFYNTLTREQQATLRKNRNPDTQASLD